LVDVTVRPSFLPRAPDKNPLTEWACHPVAFISSASVAPFGRFSSSSTLADLLPSRLPIAFFALLGAFLVEVAFLAAFALAGATCARCAPTRGFFVALGFSIVAMAVSVSASAVI